MTSRRVVIERRPQGAGQGDEWDTYGSLDTFIMYGRRDRLRGESPIDDGVPIVVGGVTPSQGDGNADYRAKWDR